MTRVADALVDSDDTRIVVMATTIADGHAHWRVDSFNVDVQLRKERWRQSARSETTGQDARETAVVVGPNSTRCKVIPAAYSEVFVATR
jgi:hypothetical protein